MCRTIASKSITVEFNINLMNCRGEPWLAHEIGCIIVGDSQNRPYIASFLPEKELKLCVLCVLYVENNLKRLPRADMQVNRIRRD